ncbi:glycogenin-1-like isoform X2 [Littorina saxatilis]|uniref:glycogenin glucosyltransferase n=2 Tax=Littorina saxatilis TaxID=31220 RepID=A0AAN9G163_9CAEN
MGDRGTREAWVTLATNDAYALGALVLGNSLRRVATTRRIVVMLTEGVSQEMRGQLQAVYDELVTVGTVDSEDERNLALLGRPDLNLTFTKIHCWELTQYQKCVFLDADTLVLQNSDELFDREELSAAPDAGWPDCFNSGVFVFQPSLETYQRIMAYAQSIGSFDGGDQGLLNSYFNTWSTQDIQKHLPFIYNVVSQAFYSYLPAFTHFRGKIKIVHFIGAIKPWHHPYNTATKTVTTFPETGHCQEFLQLWWDLFMELVQPRLDPTLTPFIRYEYVLPSTSHPPPPPPSSGHGMEGSDRREGQPTSYQVMYPYVPPALDQQFYTPPEPCPPPPPPAEWGSREEHHREEHSEGQGCSDFPRVVDMPIVSRSFHHYETHYAEDSFLFVDPDSPPPSAYQSSQFESSLVHEAEKLQPEEEGELVVSVEDETPQGAAEDRTSVEASVESGAKQTSQISAGDVKRETKKQGPNSHQKQQKKEAGGLVGELAQMKIGAGEAAADYIILDDRERRLAWERGHADYLGADSFDNIKRKLDEKLVPLPPSKDPKDVTKQRQIGQGEVSADKSTE